VSDGDARIHGRDLATAMLFGALAFGLYLALGQNVLYGDGTEFMVLLQNGAAGHKNHLAYIPLLRLAAWLGEPFGLAPFQAARLCSQAGAALGVALLHLTSCRLGLARVAAAWLTALIAGAPSVVFFATVVEVHAPYFAGVGLAWLAAAHAARAPSLASGACLGAATGLAYLGHASGFVLPGPLLLVVAHLGGLRWRTLARIGLGCAALHALVCFGVPWLLRDAGQVASPVGAARFLGWWQIDVVRDPTLALRVLWDEWLLAYLPMSLLWLRAFARARASAWVALAALAPYLALSIALLAVYREFGAYQHAVVWLFAWLTVRCWPRPLLALALLVGIGVGIGKVRSNDAPDRVASYVAGLAEVTGSAPPLLLVGSEADFEACFIGRPGTRFVALATPEFGDRVRAPAARAALTARIRAHAESGGRVFLTAGAVGAFGAPAAMSPELAYADLRAHLESTYRLQPALAAGFRAFELLAK
jgi:hypothetical protein